MASYKLKEIKRIYFSEEDGGIFCETCAKRKNLPQLSKAACRAMLYLAHSNLNSVRHLKASKTLLKEIEILPLVYLPYLTERTITGYDLLRDLLSERGKSREGGK